MTKKKTLDKPVPLPNDGVLLYYSTIQSTSANKNGKKDTTEEDEQEEKKKNNERPMCDSIISCHHTKKEAIVGVKEALELLLEDTIPEKSLESNVIKQFINGSTIKEQLSTLRAYRSTVLNLSSKNKKGEKSLEGMYDIKESQISNLLTRQIGMYRILLELGFSEMTPHPMKRASESCLSALATAILSSQTQTQTQTQTFGGVDGSSFICNDIHESVVDSILEKHVDGEVPLFWRNPLDTLFDVLSFMPTLSVVLAKSHYILATLQRLMEEGCDLENILPLHNPQCHGGDKDKSDTTGSSTTCHDVDSVIRSHVLNSIEKGVQICTMLKILLKEEERLLSHCLTNNDDMYSMKLHRILMDLVVRVTIPLIRCKATSSDAMSACSVTLGQLLCILWKLGIGTKEGIAKEVQTMVYCITGTEKNTWNDCTYANSVINWESLMNLPLLNQVGIVKGLVATLGDDILSCTVGSQQTILLSDPIGKFILYVASVSTENGARLLALKGLDTVMGRWRTILNMPKCDGILLEQATILAREILEVALVTWESPPSRQIDSAIPGLFQSLVRLMEVLDRYDAVGLNSMDNLVCKILQQPSTRKGKYVALEALLPKIGASKLFNLSKSIEKSDTGSSSSCCCFLVSSFLSEIGRRGNSSAAVAELLAKVFSMLRVEMHSEAGVDICRIEQGNRKERRKKESIISDSSKISKMGHEEEEETILLLDSWYSLWAPPLAAALLGSDDSSRTQIASFCLPLLTTFVGGKGNRINASHAFAILLDEITLQGTKGGRENEEALLWAKFEVVKHAHLLNLLKMPSTSKILSSSIAKALPLKLVYYSIFHEVSRLRLLALQSLPSLLFTYDNQQLSTSCYLKKEIDFWKIALPYAVKCSEKEYVVTITHILNSLLRRISEAEAKGQSDNCSLLLNFVNNFLFNDLFVTQVAYPGTVADKEKWALSTIESIVNRQNNTSKMKSQSEKYDPQNDLPKHHDYSRLIMANIISNDVIAALLSLVNSMWDNTRSSAYTILLNVLEYAKYNSMTLPDIMTNDHSRDLFKARAIHLASSPRQREADTGARMISILCATISDNHEQYRFLEYISNLCQNRLSMMESSLGLIHDNNEGRDPLHTNGLPLAHGLIQSLRLVVERWDFNEIPDSNVLYRTMISNCFRAIEIALIVVADIKGDSEELGPNELKLRTARAKQAKSIPINVNTGAIGANATFASLKTVNDSEKKSRLLKQRIVMGTWLLIKEACATLSSLMCSSPRPEFDLVSSAGDLLITTLTSLKHQGAAFAAHKSLQQLCILCYSTPSFQIMQLPSIWAEKVLHEISSVEIVRDSTLRRSTGYGLGFLSILRSEQVSPKFLFPNVLSHIIKLSLPASSVLKRQMNAHSLQSNDLFVFHGKCPSITELFVSDEGYEERSRIHALNILRLIILDAPLAGETREFIGDCIISSLIGYKDTSWAIRNSSTMCFAAIMLRVIDPDKNAETNLVGINEKRTRNAATANELFRSYPSLARFLLVLIDEEIESSGYQQSIHPALFPLLLMIARLQPLCLQKVQPNDVGILDAFIDPIINCLGHVHHKVRLVAARALAILCSSDSKTRDGSSRGAIIDKCVFRLSYFAKTKEISHNLDHGILLALKHLLNFAPQSENYLQGDVYEAIIYYATWSRFTLASHPLCTAVALEIWYISYLKAEQLSFPTIPKQNHSTLPLVCIKVIHCISILSSTPANRELSGFSYLSRVASETTCKIAFHQIFSRVTSSDERAISMSTVENSFTNSNYDVMLHSVKAFKKGLYDALNKLSHDTNFTSFQKMDILSSVSKLALRSINTIVNKDISACHPPTLRRLLRIALEALYEIKSMNTHDRNGHNHMRSLDDGFDASGLGKRGYGGEVLMPDSAMSLCDNSILRGQSPKQALNAISITAISDLSLDQLWDISIRLLNIGGLKPTYKNIQGDNTNGGTVLAGNALELIAFVLLELRKSANDDALPLSHQINTFVQLIEGSTHPLSSWKVRHSAALAVLNSGLMMTSHDESSSEIHRARLYIKLLELLQDNDGDVRHAAARALSISSPPKVPLLTLQDASFHLPSEMKTLDMFTLLLNQLAGRSKNIIHQMNNLLSEYEYTAGNPKHEGILNLNTERKIFEEEDPNPYEESLIITQSLVVMIANFPFDYSKRSESLAEFFCDLYSSYATVMRQMIEMFHKTEKCCDVAHNVTLDGNVFSLLHGLILSVAVGLLFGVEDGRVVSLASEILNLDTIYLHPCIRTALNLVTMVKKFDTGSQKQILQCCFLVERPKANGSVA